MDLAVGDEFPDFELVDFLGNEFRLSDFLDCCNIVLVFMYEGFGWPMSRRLVRRLHQRYDELVDADTMVIVISQNTPKSFEWYWSERSLNFVGVPDPDYSFSSAVAQLVDLEAQDEFRPEEFPPVDFPPTVIVLDKQGIIRFLSYADVMWGRITIADILADHLTPGAG